MNLTIRPICPSDYSLLEDFLYLCFYQPPSCEPFPRELIFDPEVYLYIDKFGTKPGDCGVVAVENGTTIGIAWTRIIPAYGHIDDVTPELAISMSPDFRGWGVGTKLMTALFAELHRQGYTRTSLSVQKNNPAVRFYERLGYQIINENHTQNEDYIMLKILN